MTASFDNESSRSETIDGACVTQQHVRRYENREKDKKRKVGDNQDRESALLTY